MVTLQSILFLKKNLSNFLGNNFYIEYIKAQSEIVGGDSVKQFNGSLKTRICLGCREGSEWMTPYWQETLWAFNSILWEFLALDYKLLWNWSATFVKITIATTLESVASWCFILFLSMVQFMAPKAWTVRFQPIALNSRTTQSYCYKQLLEIL